jgi:xanthine dehydrogenase YagR molybdenum-binding subunit
MSAVATGATRVEGRAKVTGAARYAVEHEAQNPAYAAIVQSTVAKGEIRTVDPTEALAVHGVLAVLSFQNAPRLADGIDGELAVLQSAIARRRSSGCASVPTGTAGLPRSCTTSWSRPPQSRSSRSRRRS